MQPDRSIIEAIVVRCLGAFIALFLECQTRNEFIPWNRMRGQWNHSLTDLVPGAGGAGARRQDLRGGG